jgi:hypothetical protein
MGPCNCAINFTQPGCPNNLIPSCWICQTCSWALKDIIISFVLCSDFCTSCYGTSSTNCYSCKNLSGTIYVLSGNSCATTCDTGYFIPSTDPTTQVCKNCDVSCLKCTLNSTNCLVNQCNIGYIYFSINSTCLNPCPNGYYNNSGVCNQCVSMCLTCSGSSSTCTSCSDGLYLFSGSCLNSCPIAGNWIANTILNLCQDCNLYCIKLNIIMFTDGTSTSPLYILMNFTENINFNDFPIKNFQNIEF